ncbi:MAG TPA: hypothetical protein DEG17_16265 [Cyanobacteria bacterium UBA11149]|nr:hypothetical protein [Cyanobacteria bacterium UBA11367]HBE58524.1 hypothetical protein [Cyanobacteria bacterium UBA11366]HBK65330.1 hypothetical protein [Cyanobacteria bacterium UBA11166]HBR72437.1 hypothetical protein [Cyanobacteria bacterium UBA11159]HBS69727.1 hypothetical protein [Cyanobacteria bacterium UBA11153]HBW90380.1 hypothetical protein [Cyanobacteria bacterium UBA11149]HCA98091.1 hypothetical protein [Cyanobacteria bacterium UBA9226]
MSKLDTILKFIDQIESENPGASAYEIANKLRGYTKRNYTTQLWSIATGYEQEYIEGEWAGKLNIEDLSLSGEITDLGHLIASLSDRINQPGLQLSDLTKWTGDHTSWAGDIGSAIMIYRANSDTKEIQTLGESLNRLAGFSDYTADIAACVIGATINYGKYGLISQAIYQYNLIPYRQHVRTFIQNELGGIIQGNKLNNPAEIEANIAQAVLACIGLSTAPDWVKSFKDLSGLNLKKMSGTNRTDILQASLHFLAHLVKMGGLESLKFKPYRMAGIRWLGNLSQEVIVS